MLMALHSLIANYETKGSFLFADLINPEHREKKDSLDSARKVVMI